MLFLSIPPFWLTVKSTVFTTSYKHTISELGDNLCVQLDNSFLIINVLSYDSVYYEMVSDAIRSIVLLLEPCNCEFCYFIWLHWSYNQGNALGWESGFRKKNYFKLLANLLDSLQKKVVLKKQCKYKKLGFPDGLADKESPSQCKIHRKWGFDPWIRKIPWSRKWQLTPVFLPGKSLGQRSLMGYTPWDCKESKHDWATKHIKAHVSILPVYSLEWEELMKHLQY